MRLMVIVMCMLVFFLMIRRPPRSTRLSHSFPTRRSSDLRALLDDRIPHSIEKHSGMRKTIARRLAQSMQDAPHIYLTVDIRLDKLMAMRAEQIGRAHV